MEAYLLQQLDSLQTQLTSEQASTASMAAELRAADLRMDSAEKNINSGFLVLCGALGFFMQTGFAMLETGSVAKNNVINILFKNITDACVAGTFWWLLGYGFAYGKSAGGFIGTDNFAMSRIYDNGLNGALAGSDGWEMWFFQWAFVGTAATIVSGSVCERMRIEAYIMSSCAVSIFIYPVVVHWVWGDGFMSSNKGGSSFFYTQDTESNGLIDFAGSGVVHMVGGLTGLMGAYLCGPRLGRFDPVTGHVNDMPEHNIAFMALGVGMLWFGWYGFNCGSVLNFVEAGELAGKVAVNTTIAAAAGCIVGVFTSYQFENVFSVSVALNGILAGLVSITAPCAVVTPWMSFIIGGVGSSIHYSFRRILFKLQIDDPLDAAPIHAFAGIWGLLSVGIFCTDDAVQYAGYPNINNSCSSGRQFATQVIGALIIIVWSITLSTIVWITVKFTIGLRVPAVLEEMGMDVMQHGNNAYGERQATAGWQLEAGGAGGMPYDEFTKAPNQTFDPYRPKMRLSQSFEEQLQRSQHGPPPGFATSGVAPPVRHVYGTQQVTLDHHQQHTIEPDPTVMQGGMPRDVSTHGIPMQIFQDPSVHGASVHGASGPFCPAPMQQAGIQRIPSVHHPQHPSSAHVPFLSQSEMAQQPHPYSMGHPHQAPPQPHQMPPQPMHAAAAF